ncbi:MAG: AmpG family muropeptide MFS transporter [Myxococcaceae bacterium]
MIYLDKRIFFIFLLGFSSGLPFWLTSGTLAFWLTESGSSNTAIGLFALVGVPYTFKFLWSPLVDRMPIPILTSLLGRRRSWMLLSQVLLAVALLALSQMHPAENLSLVAILALIVAFLSATQDIVIDAYRVDILDEKTYGAGAATIVFGYRAGMLASGAGALYLATFFSWSVVYQCMALLVGVGFLATLFCAEPQKQDTEAQAHHHWFHKAVIAPFADFITRPNWWAILLFIIFYKLGDAFVSNMTSPFYLGVGFTKIEIANITKVFGLLASLFGAFMGGVAVSRLGVLRGLFVCGLFQMLSNLVFVVQAYAGHDLSILIFVIAIENITGGMATVALVSYLSKLCNASFTATQYALLSSMMAIGRTFLSSPCGLIADAVSWPIYFGISTLVALPGMLLLVYLMRSKQVS